MTREQADNLLDNLRHRSNSLAESVEIAHLRLIINHIPDKEWSKAVARTTSILIP